MRALPLDIGTLHFVGIGGIGMSGIAEVLVAVGEQVEKGTALMVLEPDGSAGDADGSEA